MPNTAYTSGGTTPKPDDSTDIAVRVEIKPVLVLRNFISTEYTKYYVPTLFDICRHPSVC